MMQRRGVVFEEKAVEFLKLKGYKILKRNFKGLCGEIDIIAQDKETVVFIEVKARSCFYRVSGLEAVDRAKRDKIRKTAKTYASKNLNKLFRFDVLEIIQGNNWRQYNHIKDAFSMDEE
ncbi:MAG: YraN family protein [Candidatus Omnitrophica bacterium]|nr:YraN family protein [Candidatus Omnitrophota bacterium]